MKSEVLLRVENLKMYFTVRSGIFRRVNIRAVDGVSFDVLRGETLGLVGESGCGKSAMGRAVLRLYKPTSGKVSFQGIDLAAVEGEELRQLRRKMQMIFQDPYSSLTPRMTAEEIISEPMLVHGLIKRGEARKKAQELLELVNLNPAYINRFPHEFSGGQRQRIGIARALSLMPDIIICDEPIAALDVSIQAQIVNLLEKLQRELGLTYIFVAHDLSMVRHISTRVAVMYLGKMVELAGRDELYDNPMHPYTRALLSAVPIPDPKAERVRKRIILKGDVPSPTSPPSGCRFRTRCAECLPLCSELEPEWRDTGGGHFLACHLYR